MDRPRVINMCGVMYAWTREREDIMTFTVLIVYNSNNCELHMNKVVVDSNRIEVFLLYCNLCLVQMLSNVVYSFNIGCLARVESLKYIGSTIDRRGGVRKDAESRMGNA